MAKIGMGVTYRNASDRSPLRCVTEKEKREIISRYYDVHHEVFTQAVEEKLEGYGHCLIVDCHSFYPTALPYEFGKGKERPDFCIGTSEYHTPEIVTDCICAALELQGFAVKRDSPFAGTIAPMTFYERDPRVISVMIEVNRKLYLDTPGGKNARFSSIRSVLRKCIGMIENLSNA